MGVRSYWKTKIIRQWKTIECSSLHRERQKTCYIARDHIAALCNRHEDISWWMEGIWIQRVQQVINVPSGEPLGKSSRRWSSYKIKSMLYRESMGDLKHRQEKIYNTIPGDDEHYESFLFEMMWRILKKKLKSENYNNFVISTWKMFHSHIDPVLYILI